MLKRFKTTDEGVLLYKQIWYDPQQSAVHIYCGKVGYIGNIESFKVENQIEADARFESFEVESRQEGYREIDETEWHWVIVQYPLKSQFGNKRDHRLRYKVEDCLEKYLEWRMVGDVDGDEVGNKRFNIYCLVVDVDIAVSSIKTCLKDNRLKLKRAKIAARRCYEESYRLIYSHKKTDEFELL